LSLGRGIYRETEGYRRNTYQNSPRSGRSKIAQRFIAGEKARSFPFSPRSGRLTLGSQSSADIFCRPFHGLGFFPLARYPALKCWAILS
jgi:hypothetical protein